ncbi:MAG: hypothetical protein ACLFTH_00960 [Candidatus Woesearchaeota archaeon]
MKRKGQAAMEFLMTYGWAILVVLLAIGALAYFGVLSPQKLLPERTTFAAPIPNLDNAVVDAETNTVEIAFKNNKGVAITLPLNGTVSPDSGVTCDNATVSATDNKGESVDNSTSIPNGENFLVEWECDGDAPGVGSKFKADMTFDYTNAETGQTITHSGTVDGKYS